jgi:hypothetical protein
LILTEAANLYRVGHPIGLIAKRLRLSKPTILKYLKSMNLWIPRHAPSNKDRVCQTCGHLQSIGNFRNKNSRQCKSCVNARSSTYRTKNPEAYKIAVRKNKNKLLNQIAEYKKGPCIDCGFVGHHTQMEFDHRDGADKTMSVSQLLSRHASIERVIEEVQKCDLICSNCHRLRTIIERKQHRQTVSSDVLAIQRQRTTRSLNRKWIQDIKESTGCMDCGFKGLGCQLDFDHRDSNTKINDISKLVGCSKTHVQQEIDKCDIVCANCHRLRSLNRGDSIPKQHRKLSA